MQLCDGMLRLGGSVGHTVPMVGLTPAEILVLMHIHGSDALADLRPVKMDNRTHAAEYDRLSAKYDASSAFDAADTDRKSVMAGLFPGAIRKLPVSLDDIGMGWVMTGKQRPEADDDALEAARVEVATLVDANVDSLSQFGSDPLLAHLSPDDGDNGPALGDGGDGLDDDD